MDIVALLGTFKDKALDLKDIELLKHAYQLQEENITQLKTSNEAYRENIDHLRARIATHESQTSELHAKIAALQQKVVGLESQVPAQADRLSPECEQILALLATYPSYNWTDSELAAKMGKQQTYVEHYLDVLEAGQYADVILSLHSREKRVIIARLGREYTVKHQLIKA